MATFLGNQNIISTWYQDAAGHAATSASTLHRLSLSNDVKVRIAVADNKNTQTRTSRLLAQDINPDLRYALAENHNIDQGTLELLTHDDNPYVASRAQKTLTRLARVIQKVIGAQEKAAVPCHAV